MPTYDLQLVSDRKILVSVQGIDDVPSLSSIVHYLVLLLLPVIVIHLQLILLVLIDNTVLHGHEFVLIVNWRNFDAFLFVF